MKQYQISYIPDQPDWMIIPALDVDHFNWIGEADIQMQAQIGWNENGLYVHLRAWEKDIRAEYTGPLANVYEDSCMEFFFCPEEGDARYFNLEINPNGSMYIGFGHANPRPIRLVLNDEDTLLNKQVHYTDDGWEVFYTVPVSLIQAFYPDYQLAAGKVIRANCYKCGDKTKKLHYLSWNPMSSVDPSYHRPQDFGEMILA